MVSLPRASAGSPHIMLVALPPGRHVLRLVAFGAPLPMRTLPYTHLPPAPAPARNVRQEFDRSDTDELINVAQACRRIATHRASLQQRAIAKCGQQRGSARFGKQTACPPLWRFTQPPIALAVAPGACAYQPSLPCLPCRAQQSCCGGGYIPTDPAAPALLEPWEWGEWLHMCKTGGDIEVALSEC